MFCRLKQFEISGYALQASVREDVQTGNAVFKSFLLYR